MCIWGGLRKKNKIYKKTSSVIGEVFCYCNRTKASPHGAAFVAGKRIYPFFCALIGLFPS